MTSSGYEAGTCWSRDDDVTAHSEDDDDVRVSWSDSTGSPQPPVARLHHLVRLFCNCVPAITYKYWSTYPIDNTFCPLGPIYCVSKRPTLSSVITLT